MDKYIAVNEEQAVVRHNCSKWQMFCLFALATILGGIVGWFFALAITMMTIGFGGVLAGAIWGFSVGWAQSRVLSRYVPHKVWSGWVSVSTIGGAVGWLLIVGLVVLAIVLEPVYPERRYSPMFALIACLVGGSALGIAQWVILRRSQSTTWWIAANTVGFGLSGFIGLALIEPFMPIVSGGGRLYSPGDMVNDFIAGAVCTGIFGIVNGIMLTILTRRSHLSFRVV
jgi:hypothetical protein